MRFRMKIRGNDRPVVRTRLAAVLGLTLLPIAAGIAGLATTDLALQTRSTPPTMGALEAGTASTPSTPPTTPPVATAPAAPTGLVVARFVM
ncbi:hypothetical protein SVA_1552 [Sulfurifustis variabilis]|uniref:Uncharacterized protein n=1 Tax=Sulfurifustis variabilis TaxID=1675686 RepID=A0A1B4V9F4_9GAMM|nr:hypothetical protein [Sulfurifustis variabilis]BAU48114.1 hypothetical protein SVA_1552 [Sulfurifustis variabilis]